MRVTLSQVVVGLLVLLLASWFGSWVASRSISRRPALRRQRRSIVKRRVSLTVVAMLVVTLTADPAFAVGGLVTNQTPALTLPSFSELLAKFRGEPKPDWGNLPKQKDGTAAGKDPEVPTEKTRAGKGNGHKPKPGKGELPEAERLEYKPKSGPSAAGVVGFQERTSKRNAVKSSATSDYYDNADGTHTRVMSQTPVNYKDGDTWKKIDSNLSATADGVTNTANSHDATFANSAADPGLVRLTTEGHSISYGLAGAAAVPPAVKGSTATYGAVLPQTDLQLEATPIGIKETLVLNGPDAPSEWVFPLDSGTLTPVLDSDTGVRFDDANGKTVVRIPGAFAEDSKINPKSGMPAMNHGITYRLEDRDGRKALVMALDEKWLRSPDRVFPVKVDPSYTIFSATTYVMTNAYGDHSMERFIAVGSWDNGPHTARSYVKFPDQGLDGSGVTVATAKLQLFNTWASTCTAQQVDMFEGLEPWNSWDQKMKDFNTAPGYTQWLGYRSAAVTIPCTNTSFDPAIGEWIDIPVATANIPIIQGWANGTRPNHGVVLAAPVNDNAHWKQFSSANNWTTGPKFVVTYTTGKIAPRIRNQAPADGAAFDTLTPTLSATGEVDPSIPNNIRIRFKVYNESNAVIADSGNLTTTLNAASWQIPANTLTWGKSYYWTAETWDGTSYSTNTQWYTLSTQVPQPSITSSLSQNGGQGFDASNGNYTTTATDADVETTGPDLAVIRDYNSRDPRISGAFGAGWSSVFDAEVAEQYLPGTTTVKGAYVTYPEGSVVGFGKNPDGTFAPPSGRYVSFRTTTSPTGYTLTDKNGTVYTFTQSLGGGRYGVTSIADANARAITFTWTSGKITKVTSGPSNRSLNLVWTTPSGALKAHVTTVTTDPAVAGNNSTIETWTYNYTGDKLTGACSSGCIQYGYVSGSNYHSQVLDQGADAYWPLAEPAGSSVAVSANLATQASNNALYRDVTLGTAGSLAGGSATAASFNGTSSAINLPNNFKIGTKRPQAISLWFKGNTANGILYSYQFDNPLYAGTTPSDYTPALYVNSDGKLAGSFFTNQAANQYVPIVSTPTVTDNAWHNVVLTGDGGTQWLYLDGALVGSKTGLHEVPGQWINVVGGGYFGYKWPKQPYESQTVKTGTASFYKGSIANVALFDKTLTQNDVSSLYTVGKTPTALLTSTTRPSGKAYAAVTYDGVSGTVTNVTDSNGGAWNIGTPQITGSNGPYRGAVLGSAPAAYYRLADLPGATDASNEVNSGKGTYANATLLAPGPLADSATEFNGTSSYVQLPTNNQVSTGPGTVEMWFKTEAGSTAGGVLFGQQDHTLVGASGADWGYVPALYVGTDGKLHGKFWDANGTGNGLVSTNKVNDGNWHHVMLSATTNSQSLYVDGAPNGTVNGALQTSSTNFVYVGAGMAGGAWPAHPVNTLGYFKGSIAHVAYYRTALTTQDADAHVAAARDASGPAPTKTVAVRDPGNKYIVNEYELASGRQIAQSNPVDAVPSPPTSVPSGQKTKFGYDSGGFLRTITDPNGNMDITGHDVRGNEVSKTTCQNHATNKCSTSYFTYWPDATTKTLTPNPKNDVMDTERDGRSTGPTDDTYLTVYGTDAKGNQTDIVTPPVPGFPGGRFTRTSYTDGTTVAAYDTGFAPPGLPYKTVSPSGATTNIRYFKNGDVAEVTDAGGLITRFTYDGLGRQLTKTVISDSFPSGVTETFKYDAVGQLIEENDPAILNRVTGAVHTAKTVTAYDADGNPTSQTVTDLTGGDALRTSSSTYNAQGLLATATDARGKVTSFTYDTYGNKASETDPTGQVTTYTYDASGKPLTQTLKNYVGDPNNPVTPYDLVQSSSSYDPGGRLATTVDALGRISEYSYTDNDLLAKIVKKDAAGQNPFVDRETTYDAAGNAIKQVTNNGATVTESSVDTSGRVVATTVDPTGVNRTTTVSYTPDDQVATSTQTTGSTGTRITSSYTYDAMGRMTSQSLGGDEVGSPVGWWRLNQTSGSTVHDATGRGVTAAAGSGVTWSDDAAVFNGTADAKIMTNGPVVDTSQSFSVSAWTKPTALTGTQTIVSQDGNRMSGFFLKYEGGNGKWSFMRVDQDSDNPTVWASAQSTGAAVANQWVHLTATFNAADGTMKLYVNGQPQGTAALPSAFNATGSLVIGRAKYAGNPVDYANGSIANVQAYNRLLSDTDVTKLYTNGRNGDTTASYTKQTTKYTLDKRGLPTKVTDPNGNATDIVYDEAGNEVLTTGPTVSAETGGGTPVAMRPVTTMGYDTFGSVTEQQDPKGNVTRMAYDAEGNQVSVTQPNYTAPGTSTPIVATRTWAYDNAGSVTDMTDANNDTTHYDFDQLGNVYKVTDAGGKIAKSKYNANSELIGTTTATGAQTQATFDHLGRPLTETTLERYPSPVTATTTYSYTASASNPGGAFLASATSAEGKITRFGYNAVGEQTTLTDPANAVTTTQYDLLGRPVKVTAGDNTSTATTYDVLGNPLTVKQYDTDGTTVLKTTSASYDAAGRNLTVTDGRGNTMIVTRDSGGLVTSQTEPVDATTSIVTSYGYDANGNRTRYTDGRGNAWIYGYNTWNMLESTLEPSTPTHTTTANRQTTIRYDAEGQPVLKTMPGGVTVTNGFDDVGNLTSQSGSGADAATASRSFTYDADGRLLTAGTSSIGTTVAATNLTYTYDDRGQPLTSAGTAGTGSFAYNKDGQLTSRVDAAGTTAYGYDTAGRLSTIDDPLTGTRQTYGYDVISQPTSIAYGTNGKNRTFTYDKLHRLKTDTLKTSGGTTVASIAYGYDGNSNLTSKNTTGMTGAANNTYTYDRANRITGWNNGTTNVPYEYDASGNRTRVGGDVFTYDARDQLTSDGHTTYTYSARGTLLSQSGTQNGTFTTDAYNQQVTQAASGGGNQTYLMDAFGRVMTVSGVTNHTFKYSGTANTLASDGSSTYSWAPDDSLVGIGVQGGTTAQAVLAMTDQHDDVVGNFTTTSTGLTGSTTYDPLGNIKATTGTSGRLGFQSGWTDTAAQGKVNMLSRWYNPATGQFQNKDTLDTTAIGNSANGNPFAYVADNPLAGTDPSGHCFFSCIKKAASSAWNNATTAVSTYTSNAWNYASTAYSYAADYTSRAWDYTVRATKTVTKKIKDAKKSVTKRVKQYYHKAVKKVRQVKKAVTKVVKKATKAVAKKVKKAAKNIKKAAKAVKKAAKTAAKSTVKFVKAHAADIAVAVVSTVAFAGCAAVLGAVTAGVGAIACGAVAGAVAGLVEQGFKCAEGQKGSCSVSSFVKSGLLGGATGALSGVTGGLGGALAKNALKKGLPKIASNVLEESFSGAADSAVNYGMTCASSGGGCSWKGAVKSTASGATPGGIPSLPRARSPITAPTKSSTCHSFTASTKVLMADGTAKPISKLKVGDKIKNAVADSKGKTETNRISKVIVTPDDREFVDLTITTKKQERGPPPTGTLTTTFHHPFYSFTHSSWVEAKDLKPGDELQQPNGDRALVTKTQHYLTDQTTYDLTINTLHTYYVLAGSTPVLVHNCTNVLSNAGDIDNAATMAAHEPGAAFSGVFDPGSGGMRAHLNVEARGPGSPPNVVNRTGGHGEVNFLHFGGSRDTVAFTAFREEGGLSVSWLSRSVNGRNHGSTLAPEHMRQQVMDSLMEATGWPVWSR
ncbi:hypothetical protein GCM10027589_06290 [Actinocorallia lasiicapitis]